ncbi:MAG: 7-carboxy-7-deazaguanine synthase QueE [Campylobacterota bacterium]|nr:7-carboxy-7-deazaguanine synthase QueE [Campylobacterota bacterium]
MLEINEIFGPTIQGEGKKIGTPSVFVRFGKCNMQCAGFEVEYETPSGIKKCSCDSYYASDIAFQSQWEKYPLAKDLINTIDKLIPNYNIDIVITGGEPLLYWNDIEFQNFLEHYIKLGHHITIETNASLNISFKYNWQKEILFSMSVKLENSGEPLRKRVNIKTLTDIINFTNESYLKFVIDTKSKDNTSIEIDNILEQIPECEVYLMPMGDTIEDINNNSLSVISLAVQKGYKYSDRLHIRVWNNQRGV